MIHYDNGFTLMEDQDVETAGVDSRPPPTILWQHPYERLRTSADDGHRLLWLDFGDDGEQVKLVLVIYFVS